MTENKALEIYNECMNMDLSQMQDIIEKTDDPNKQDFYVELYNYVLKTRQQKVIADGKF